MKLRSPWMIRLAAILIAGLMRLWVATLRVRIVSIDGQEHPIDPQQQRVIYAFWHEAMLAAIVRRAPAHVLISQHADGELIAQVCRRIELDVIRGSSSRGGSQALLEMIHSGDCKHLVVTPDGPRGPRRHLHPGIVTLAANSRLPIMLFGVGFVRAWRAPSWDRWAAPLPFSTMTGVMSEPIYLPRDLSRAAVEQQRQILENRLLELTSRAETWAARMRAGDCTPPHFSLADERQQKQSA